MHRPLTFTFTQSQETSQIVCCGTSLGVQIIVQRQDCGSNDERLSVRCLQVRLRSSANGRLAEHTISQQEHSNIQAGWIAFRGFTACLPETIMEVPSAALVTVDWATHVAFVRAAQANGLQMESRRTRV